MKHFHLSAASGIIAAAGAGTVLFAWHNDATNVQHIQRMRARFNAVVPAALEFAIELALAAFGDDYTDGSDLSDPATAANYAVRNRNLDKLRVLASAWRPTSTLASGNVRIASTASLTAGASPPTVDAHAFSRAGDLYVAAGPIQPVLDLLWQSPTLGSPDGSIPLEQDRGFVVRVPIAMGATLTGRLAVEIDWLET